LFPHTDGGFCEYKTVRADQLVPLPAAVGTRLGALAEPLAVAIHAVRRAIGAFGDLRRAEILVNGVGPIGALVVAVAKRFGAGLVVASDVTPAALDIGRAMGADDAVNAATGPLPAEVPLVFEASGAAAALGAVLRATARGGVLVQVGNLPARPVSAVLGDLVTREITWLGSFRFVGEMSQAVELLADGLDIEPIITHSFPLAQAAEAMAVAADRRTGSSKVMLDLSRPAEPPAPLPGPTSNQGESNAES
jgi:L-idonate 5-dehydrogenase